MPAQLGFVSQPHYGDYAALKAEVADFVELQKEQAKYAHTLHIRLVISWADWAREDGHAWTHHVVGSWADAGVRPLITFMWTPPSWGIIEEANAPPRDPALFWGFLRWFNERFAEQVGDWQQVWAEPNGQPYWDRSADPDWHQFAVMHLTAAQVLREEFGKKVLMPGIIPSQGDQWIALMCDYGVVQGTDAVATHAFPGTWLPWRTGVHSILTSIRRVLHEKGIEREIWIPEYSYSTAQGIEPSGRAQQWHQLRCFQRMLRLETPWVYWHSLRDLATQYQSAIADHCNAPDLREHGCGLKTADGTPKLLYEVLATRSLEEIRTTSPLDLAIGW